MTIESVLNSDYTVYQCIATNALGQDEHNISLTSPNIPDSPLNLEVSMKDYRTVTLKVLIQANITFLKVLTDIDYVYEITSVNKFELTLKIVFNFETLSCFEISFNTCLFCPICLVGAWI